MIGFDEQIELFELIGKELDVEVECYAIGGTALLFIGLKDATKDVDLVFEDEGGRVEFRKALERIGFEESTDFEIYGHEEAIREEPIILERGESRFDLFLKDIISFRLSPGIKEGVREKHEFNNLKLFVVSPEHLLLLKCATDRKGDRIDAKNMVGNINIDWEKIIDEVEWQTDNGRKIFSVFLYDFLIELKEDFHVDVPKNVLKKLRKIGERKMLEELEDENGKDLTS